MALTLINQAGRVFGYVAKINFWYDITNNIEKNKVVQIAESNGRLYALDAAGTLWRFNDTTDYTANLDAGRVPLWTSVRTGVTAFTLLVNHNGEYTHCLDATGQVTLYEPGKAAGKVVTANGRSVAIALAHFNYQLDEAGVVYEARDARGYKAIPGLTASAIVATSTTVIAIDRTAGTFALWNTSDRWLLGGPARVKHVAATTHHNYVIREDGTAQERNDTNGLWTQLGSETFSHLAASNNTLFGVSDKDGGIYQYTGDHRKVHGWKRIGDGGAKLLAVDLV